MTDFAKPTTPAEALRQRAEMVEYRIRQHEQKIREAQVAIEELRHELGELLNDADDYDKYQPAPQVARAAGQPAPEQPT